MDDMLTINSIAVQKNWDKVLESAIYVKPIFIKNNLNYMIHSNIEFMASLLSGYKFSAKKYVEDDGSVIIFVKQLCTFSYRNICISAVANYTL